MADSTPVAEGLTIDELKKKLGKLLPAGGATIRQTVEVAYKIKNEKHVKDVLGDFSRLAGQPEEKIKSVMDFMNSSLVKNKELLSTLMDKDSLAKAIQQQYRVLDEFYTKRNVSFGHTFKAPTYQRFTDTNTKRLEQLMQTYVGLYGMDFSGLDLSKLDITQMDFTPKALAPVKELQGVIQQYAQTLNNEILEKVILTMKKDYEALDPSAFGGFLSTLSFDFSKETKDSALRKKYDVSLETFKKEVEALFEEEQSLLEKLNNDDDSTDEDFLKAKKAKVEIYKYIAGQEKRGGVQWEKAKKFLAEGLDVERAVKNSTMGTSAERIEHGL